MQLVSQLVSPSKPPVRQKLQGKQEAEKLAAVAFQKIL